MYVHVVGVNMQPSVYNKDNDIYIYCCVSLIIALRIVGIPFDD